VLKNTDKTTNSKAKKNILHTFAISRAKTKTQATNSAKFDINMKI